LFFDRVGGPQRGAVALLFARALECQRGAADAQHVAKQDRLQRVVRNLTDQCVPFACVITEREDSSIILFTFWKRLG